MKNDLDCSVEASRPFSATVQGDMAKHINRLESKVKELEAELALSQTSLKISNENAESFHAQINHLRECLRRLIDAHNNDADMDIYDNLIIEAAAALKEGK